MKRGRYFLIAFLSAALSFGLLTAFVNPRYSGWQYHRGYGSWHRHGGYPPYPYYNYPPPGAPDDARGNNDNNNQ